MALTITEEWIHRRVNLRHSNLDDVRSLSLPGTYDEKISHLGTSLKKFSRLKQLDISRNDIYQLEGLEKLTLLEKLNLYYNNIQDLSELYRLRFNQKLCDIDLRLNPVARNEPDYRLFLIHLLPNLRRLDDRAVRDSERKAALMHFSSEQANLITEHKPSYDENTHRHPRPLHVKSLGKPPALLEDDDCVLMDIVNKTSKDLYNAHITGSSETVPNAQDYSAEALRKLNLEEGRLSTSTPVYHTSDPPHPATEQLTEETNTNQAALIQDIQQQMQARYPNLPIIVNVAIDNQNVGHTEHHLDQPHCHSRSNSAAKPRIVQEEKKHLKFTDEIDAYTTFTSKGHFTPKPTHTDQTNCKEVLTSRDLSTACDSHTRTDLYSDLRDPCDAHTGSDMLHHYSTVPSMDTHQRHPTEPYFTPSEKKHEHPHIKPDPQFNSYSTRDTHQKQPNSLSSEIGLSNYTEYNKLIEQLSNLTDKYWNGSKSLISNPKFYTATVDLLKSHRTDGDGCMDGDHVINVDGSVSKAEYDAQEVHLRELESEIKRLRAETSRPLATPTDIANATDSKLKSTLIRAQRDLTILRGRLQASIEENKMLQNKLADVKYKSTDIRSGTSTDGCDTESLREENRRLLEEITSMKEEVAQTRNLRELATMLQDSHKSLVMTNEHLRSQIGQPQKHPVTNDGTADRRLRRVQRLLSGTA